MKALFFTPFTGIHQHSTAEASLAVALKSAGVDIEVITCGGCYRGQCVTLSAYGIFGTTDQKKISRTCKRCTAVGASLFGPSLTLEELLRGGVNTASEMDIEKLLSGITAENFFDFEFDGMKVGKIAGYQHLLKFKKNSLNISADEFPIFRTEMKNCLMTYQGLKVYNTQSRVPELVFIYNTLYSVNAVARYYFEGLGSTVYTMHAGSNLRHFYDTLLIAKHHTLHFALANRNLWPRFSDKQITRKGLSFLEGHFDELMLGRSAFAYSAPSNPDSANPRDYFKVAPEQKVILIAMSSNDENFAAIQCGAWSPERDEVFPTQIEWASSLLEFAKTRKDLFFVFRIHPRELPNKREGLSSEQSKALFEVLRYLPSNAALNVPSDGFSIYQIIAVSDLVLTAWSSAGLESTLLGLPVLGYSANFQDTPEGFLEVAKTKESYFEKIDLLLGSKWRIERSIKAARWYALQQERNCVQFETKSPVLTQIQKFRGAERVLNRLVPGLLPKLGVRSIELSERVVNMLRNREENPAIHVNYDAESLSPAAEIESVKRFLRRIGTLAFGAVEKWPKGFGDMLQ